MTLLELDATEKCSDILWAVKEENEKEPLVISKELQCVKDVIVGQGINIDNQVAFSHAVYTEELVTFMVANMQLHQLSMVQGKWMTSGGDEDNCMINPC